MYIFAFNLSGLWKFMAEYFIGIDGGGTKSKLVLVNKNLNVISEQTGSGTNLLSVGIENAANIFYELIEKAVSSSNISISYIKGIVIGTAGAGRKKQSNLLKTKLSKILENNKFTIKNILITSDAEITLKGAVPNNAGIILIAGTGSILYGKNKKGKIFRIGGMGKLIGDEGSGYSIGRKGLSFVSKVFDEREKTSLLFELFKENYNIETQSHLIDEVYNNNFNIAGFAKTVIEAARKGDDFAKSILLEESDELLKHISTAMNLLNSDKLNLTLSGSLLANENHYSKMLKNKISKKFEKINLCTPKYSPEIGAALLSIENYEKTNGS